MDYGSGRLRQNYRPNFHKMKSRTGVHEECHGIVPSQHAPCSDIRTFVECPEYAKVYTLPTRMTVTLRRDDTSQPHVVNTKVSTSISYLSIIEKGNPALNHTRRVPENCDACAFIVPCVAARCTRYFMMYTAIPEYGGPARYQSEGLHSVHSRPCVDEIYCFKFAHIYMPAKQYHYQSITSDHLCNNSSISDQKVGYS
jgi:hypothetical protein